MKDFNYKYGTPKMILKDADSEFLPDNKIKYRMYHLTMYNISEIQKGIQCYHAGIEYALKYWSNANFQQWANHDKTVIILNGGTSNEGRFSDKGSMEQNFNYLTDELKIECAAFIEPDLNNSMSGICFLIDERVYDKKTYPEFSINTNEYSYKGDNFPEFISMHPTYANPMYSKQVDERYAEWLESIGGESNRKLRLFLKQFKLA